MTPTLITILLCVVFLGAFAPGLSYIANSQIGAEVPEELLLLDYQKGRSLVITLPGRRLEIRVGDNIQDVGVVAVSAKFLESGDVLFIDDSLALKKVSSEGIAELLPAGSANAPLFVSGDQQQIAYLKPKDFYGGGSTPLSNGIAVMNLSDGTEKVLFELPNVTIHLRLGRIG